MTSKGRKSTITLSKLKHSLISLSVLSLQLTFLGVNPPGAKERCTPVADKKGLERTYVSVSGKRRKREKRQKSSEKRRKKERVEEKQVHLMLHHCGGCTYTQRYTTIAQTEKGVVHIALIFAFLWAIVSRRRRLLVNRRTQPISVFLLRGLILYTVLANCKIVALISSR